MEKKTESGISRKECGMSVWKDSDMKKSDRRGKERGKVRGNREEESEGVQGH